MAFFSTNSGDYVSAIRALKKPEYESKYDNTISGIMDKIANREQFSYDFNADPLFQNMKDNYTKMGKEAAMNAASSVSNLTGGYGNSYAATAASQANQQYMSQLNEQIPELAKAALDKYQMETQDLYNQFGMYQSEENRLYGQHRDQVSDYYSDWSNLLNGYGIAQAQENNDRNFNYQVSRDQIADSQWQRQFDNANSQWQKQFDNANDQWQKTFDTSNEHWQKEYDLKLKNAAKKASTSNGLDKNSKSSNNDKWISSENGMSLNFTEERLKNFAKRMSESDDPEGTLRELVGNQKFTMGDYNTLMKYYH